MLNVRKQKLERRHSLQKRRVTAESKSICAQTRCVWRTHLSSCIRSRRRECKYERSELRQRVCFRLEYQRYLCPLKTFPRTVFSLMCPSHPYPTRRDDVRNRIHSSCVVSRRSKTQTDGYFHLPSKRMFQYAPRRTRLWSDQTILYHE